MAEKGRAIPIKRTNPNHVIPTFVNDMIVTHSQNEIYVTFSVIEPPSVLSENEFEDIQSVDGIAISKLVMSPEFAEAVIKVLSENLVKFKESERSQ